MNPKNKCCDAYGAEEGLTISDVYEGSLMPWDGKQGYIPHPLVNKTDKQKYNELINKLEVLLKEFKNVS